MVTYERSVVSPLVLNEDMSSLPEIGVRTILGDRDDFKAQWGQLLAGQVGSLLAKQQIHNTGNSKVPKLCLGLHVPWELSDEKNGDLVVYIMELIQKVRVW
ncbi:proteasome assembly chaperone Pac3 [Schizosaccharomyces osmophilus]|uniref:Proteasome assembly chaperone Pac3 n=1 Tax=Schizosaccharomyces osmophilus TaxID=2545709 RepID=A0AAF0AVB8_9SCHI|nr:proteasome assembly chaperone Pac3 [Schizosaccharomyces osmophilus]WBW72377.1 proteasome assembly chaperone Pac3 [Schizosaccharomyces osmophilus]